MDKGFIISMTSNPGLRCQVIVVGDLNVAASQRDVHGKLRWADMYGAEEKAEMAALLSALPDVWRLRHPDACNAFTVQAVAPGLSTCRGGAACRAKRECNICVASLSVCHFSIVICAAGMG